MKQLFPILLCALLPLGCDTASPDDDQPIEQTILFEVEYANFAWVPTRLGFYVDRQGQVYTYDLSDTTWTPERRDALTEEELLQKYSYDKTLTGTIASTTLYEHVALIRPASEGTLSDPLHRCADAGANTFTAYLYDTGAARYKPVLLRLEGDVAQDNLSSSAQSLVAWLRTLDERFSQTFCAP